MNDRPLHRQYGRLELERRFLLGGLPHAVSPDDYESLHDIYVYGTHLRVRHVHRPNGDWLTTKLGQKVPNPDAPNDPRQRKMTTIYVPFSEIAALEKLDGLRTIKRRYKLFEQGFTWCIDVWQEPLGAAGTIVAEVETPTLDELERIKVPVWAIDEVTGDPRFSAIDLASRPPPTHSEDEHAKRMK